MLWWVTDCCDVKLSSLADFFKFCRRAVDNHFKLIAFPQCIWHFYLGDQKQFVHEILSHNNSSLGTIPAAKFGLTSLISFETSIVIWYTSYVQFSVGMIKVVFESFKAGQCRWTKIWSSYRKFFSPTCPIILLSFFLLGTEINQSIQFITNFDGTLLYSQYFQLPETYRASALAYPHVLK